MNNIQIKQLSDKLDELGKFSSVLEKSYRESEIIDWIAECVNVFYEIGVDSVIIRHFLDYFNLGITEVERDRDSVFFPGDDKFEKVRSIGPFLEQVSGSSYFRMRSGRYSLVGSFYYVKIAFSSARNVLKNKVEEKRIVPHWLIAQISELDEVRHIASSLELIENKYEQRDAYGLVTESITLLDGILNLDVALASKDKLGAKLNFLIENKDKRETFGVSKDLVVGLNCERILRNEKIIHKDAPLKYELPFMIATSFAYLVLFFVECAILNGKVINYE